MDSTSSPQVRISKTDAEVERTINFLMETIMNLVERATRDIMQDGPYMGDDDSIFNRQYRQTMEMATRPTIFVGVKADDFRPEQLGDAATKKVEIVDMTELEATLDANPHCDLIVIKKEFFQVAQELSARRVMPNCVCVSGAPGALKMELVDRP